MLNQLNIEVREGMTLSLGEKVEVYYNLHKGGFSIKSLDKANPNKGKVVAYAASVILEQCEFKFAPKAIERIRDKGQKEVYARIKGNLLSATSETIEVPETTKLGYINPYTTGYFVDKETGNKLDKASKVYMYGKSFNYEGGKE